MAIPKRARKADQSCTYRIIYTVPTIIDTSHQPSPWECGMLTIVQMAIVIVLNPSGPSFPDWIITKLVALGRSTGFVNGPTFYGRLLPFPGLGKRENFAYRGIFFLFSGRHQASLSWISYGGYPRPNPS